MLRNQKWKYIWIVTGCIAIALCGVYGGYRLITGQAPKETPIENHLAHVEPFSTEDPESGENENGQAAKFTEDLAENRDKVTAETKIVYRYVYSENETIEDIQETIPSYLLGKSQGEISTLFPQWRVIAFSSEEIILQKEMNTFQTQQYIVGIQDGYVAVFYQEPIHGATLKEITNTPVSPLSQEEQDRLQNGITITGEEQLIKILEDYGS